MKFLKSKRSELFFLALLVSVWSIGDPFPSKYWLLLFMFSVNRVLDISTEYADQDYIDFLKKNSEEMEIEYKKGIMAFVNLAEELSCELIYPSLTKIQRRDFVKEIEPTILKYKKAFK